MADCVFCRVIDGSIEAHRVYEDETSLGFLDHRPLFPGHVLLVPRDHVVTLAELSAASVEPLFLAARLLAAVVEAAMQAEGTFVAINQKVSQSVPHLHVHIVPRRRKDGLRGFFWPRNPYDGPEHAEAVAEALREALRGGRPGDVSP